MTELDVSLVTYLFDKKVTPERHLAEHCEQTWYFLKQLLWCWNNLFCLKNTLFKNDDADGDDDDDDDFDGDFSSFSFFFISVVFVLVVVVSGSNSIALLD